METKVDKKSCDDGKAVSLTIEELETVKSIISDDNSCRKKKTKILYLALIAIMDALQLILTQMNSFTEGDEKRDRIDT